MSKMYTGDKIKQVHLRVTKDEYEYIKNRAEYLGISISEFILKSVREIIIVNNDKLALKDLFTEMNRIGINVNQIAKAINQNGGRFEQKQIDDLQNQFNELMNLCYSKILETVI